MRKHRKRLITVASLAAVAAIIAFLSRDTEPHDGGRSLSEWLRPAPGQRPSRELSPEAQTAIRHMGTNALPTVLRWISYEPSLGRTKFRQYLGFLLPKGGDPGDRQADDAVRVFATLGCQAVPAIPELARLAETSTRGTWRGRRCVDALYSIGPESFPALHTMITNNECRFRLRK